MPLGPVFQVELLTTARRARYYVLRALYGLLMLGLLAQFYYDRFRYAPKVGTLSIREMAEFGAQVFRIFVVCQGVVVFLLTPALVAGAVSDERQRKTLHYLLASRLSSPEIVLGKLGARLLHLLVLLTIGLPILALLGLFGGVAPELVAWTYAGTLSTMLLLASLSIFVSSVPARRVRDAILMVYVIEIAWLALPPIFREVARSEWPAAYAWVASPLDWVIATGPIGLIDFRRGPVGGTFLDALRGMIGLQAGLSLALVFAAVLGLRPSFRNEGRRLGIAGLPRRLGRPLRLRPRRACGDDPMLWKETQVARLRGPVRIILVGFGLVVTGLTLYGTYTAGLEAATDLGENGLGVPAAFSDRDAFNQYIRVVSLGLYCLTALIVAVSAATTMTSEREEDTWTSLIATTLTGREVVLAKLFGAVWAARRLVGLILIVWCAGVGTASLHPYGFLLSLAELLAYLGFAAALGVSISLNSRATGRALATTIAALVFLNGGYLVLLILFQPDSPLIAIGCTPYILTMSLFSYRDLWQLLGWTDTSWSMLGGLDNERWQGVAMCLLSPTAYGLAAVVLAWRAVARFDAVADRPRLAAPVAQPSPRVAPLSVPG